MTTIPPQTPVLIGAATLQQRLEEPGAGREAVELMVAALELAADRSGCPALLQRADRIEVPKGIWGYSDPARLIADAIGAASATTVLAEIGILQQSLINRACDSIARGEAVVILVAGAEAKYRALRCQIADVEVPETTQSDVEADLVLTPDAELWSPVESAAGLGMPVGYYAIMDSALRHAQGMSVDAHREQMAQMYADFSAVAAGNEDAWLRKTVDADTIREPSAKNPMLAFPYTKLHNSQWNVDQAAGLIFCAAGVAEELGIAREHWVFPLAATESNAMSVLAARVQLHRNQGFKLAGEKLLALTGKRIEDIELLELYSCFPQAVRVQLQELGLSPARPLTVTGGMTFAGGPLNNYVLQATAKMAERLQQKPGASGLVTSVSGMNTKQACALYCTDANPDGWQFSDLSAEVAAATALTEVLEDYAGEATIAGFTVLYQAAEPWRAVVVCDLPTGQRTVAYSEEPGLIAAMLQEEFVGRRVRVSQGQFS
ncbi:MAG: hypothetical protein ABJ308_03265 [Halieaceae bacterium]